MTDELEQYEPEFQITDPGDEQPEEPAVETPAPPSFPDIDYDRLAEAIAARQPKPTVNTENEEAYVPDTYDRRVIDQAKAELRQEISPYLQQTGQMAVGTLTSDEHEKAYIEGWCKENNIDPQTVAMTPALAKLAKDAARGHKLSQKRAPGYESPDMDASPRYGTQAERMAAAIARVAPEGSKIDKERLGRRLKEHQAEVRAEEARRRGDL